MESKSSRFTFFHRKLFTNEVELPGRRRGSGNQRPGATQSKSFGSREKKKLGSSSFSWCFSLWNPFARCREAQSIKRQSSFCLVPVFSFFQAKKHRGVKAANKVNSAFTLQVTRVLMCKLNRRCLRLIVCKHDNKSNSFSRFYFKHAFTTILYCSICATECCSGIRENCTSKVTAME